MNFLFKPWIKSFIFNPSYIIRKELYKWINNNKIFIGWKVLDFWCWEKPYKEIFTYNEYIWIDFEKTGHDNKDNSIDIYWNWKDIPTWNEEFDSFISTEVFEHIFNLDEVLKELYRVLKIWGTWIITIPFCIWEHEIPYDFARYNDITHKNIYTDNSFNQL